MTPAPASRRALLGLGSNVGDRDAHLATAVRALDVPDAAPGDRCRVEAVSDVWATDPVGGPDQDDFHNLVVAVETDRSARDLLATCERLEAAAERVRTVRWGPRTLDVDVLWIDGETVDEPDLVVPHPRAHQRRFVLVPLAQVAPDVEGALRDLGRRRGEAPDDGRVERLGPLPWRQ